jgi:uncharacterized protein
MQDVTPLIPEGKKILQSYGAGKFTVNGEKFESSIILLPNLVIAISCKAISQLTEADITPLIENKNDIEFILVGTGNSSDFMPSNIEKKLKENQIKFEYMNTGPACRTYNVLLSEERKFASILIVV